MQPAVQACCHPSRDTTPRLTPSKTPNMGLARTHTPDLLMVWRTERALQRPVGTHGPGDGSFGTSFQSSDRRSEVFLWRLHRSEQ